jgi:outer membrane protein
MQYKRLIRLSVALLLTGVGNAVVTAEHVVAEDSSATLTIDLRGAVATALKQNIDIQIATLNIAAQQQEKNIARSALLPHASLDASESIERFNLKATFGLQLPDVPNSIGPFQSIHAGPSFQVPVFDLSLIEKYQASGHLFSASRQDARAVREQMVLLTVSEYTAHLRATADVAAAQARVTLATRLLNQAQDLKTDGVATKVDVSRAHVRLSEENQRLIDAKTQEQTTLYALKRILNLSNATELKFSDDQDFFSTPDLQADVTIDNALKSRPDLLSLSDAVAAAKSEHKAATSKVLPVLTANGRWDEEGPNLTRLVPGYKYELDFKVPIFTGGRLKAEREEAAINERKAAMHLADARNRVVEQTKDGQAELKAATDQVFVAKKQVSLAQEELELAQGRFSSGVTDNIEVVAGQDALAHANDAQIAALYRYAVARAQLARAVGAAEQTYTQP